MKIGKFSAVNSLLGLGIAMAIGATIGLMLAPKTGEEMREDTLKKARKIAQRFRRSRSEIETMVKEIFGEINEELEKNYLEIRGQVLAMVEELRESELLDKDNYQEAVERIVTHVSKGKKWSRTAIKKLIKSLQKEWDNYM